ncbi:hypothetical protein FS837_006878, partial [Tulasnella sp. UAMH 9824]
VDVLTNLPHSTLGNIPNTKLPPYLPHYQGPTTMPPPQPATHDLHLPLNSGLTSVPMTHAVATSSRSLLSQKAKTIVKVAPKPAYPSITNAPNPAPDQQGLR